MPEPDAEEVERDTEMAGAGPSVREGGVCF